MPSVVEAGDAITLSSDEVLFLRSHAGVPVEEESPFGKLEATPSKALQKAAVRSLAERSLADSRTHRPNRELIRRLLIVCQPDSRVVLLRAGPGQGERILDLYQRAGAFVRYSRTQDSHRFGAVLEFVDVVDEISTHFRPRRSTGDFVELRLTAAEHFAFSILAAEIVSRREDGRTRPRVGYKLPSRADSALVEHSLDGAVLVTGRRVQLADPRVPPPLAPSLKVPSESAWRAALEGLAEKDVVESVGKGEFELRGYLHDLAHGLAAQNRHVLTRFDFGPNEWIVRDATFVPVTGSVFLLRTLHDGGLFVRELDQDKLYQAVKHAIDDVHDGTTIDL
jgi:hypothetical protein